MSTKHRTNSVRTPLKAPPLHCPGQSAESVAESKPRVTALFARIEALFAEIGLLPATPFTKALGYLRDRKVSLSAFLDDPGVAQSLIVTCQLHGVDVYTYLVDVLQRVGSHPASRVAEQLTPRRWNELFANRPLRSPLHTRSAYASTPRG